MHKVATHFMLKKNLISAKFVVSRIFSFGHSLKLMSQNFSGLGNRKNQCRKKISKFSLHSQKSMSQKLKSQKLMLQKLMVLGYVKVSCYLS